MRTLLLLYRLAGTLAALSAAATAWAGEIIILESGNRAPHRANRPRDVLVHDPLTGDSFIVIERSAPDEELDRRDPGREAARAARAARRHRTKSPPPLSLEAETLFSIGRGDAGQEAARAARDAHRMRTER